ncbi:MAG: hypothetical protein ACRDZO_10015 [Egibacteraceae bacterium]
MRRLRINPPAQMSLDLPTELGPAGELAGWWSLPEPCRAQVLMLLARLIARGVVVTDDDEPGVAS